MIGSEVSLAKGDLCKKMGMAYGCLSLESDLEMKVVAHLVPICPKRDNG